MSPSFRMASLQRTRAHDQQSVLALTLSSFSHTNLAQDG